LPLLNKDCFFLRLTRLNLYGTPGCTPVRLK
jgi:hypothetical protein